MDAEKQNADSGQEQLHQQQNYEPEIGDQNVQSTKRKLYSIEENEDKPSDGTNGNRKRYGHEAVDAAYDADVDEDIVVTDDVGCSAQFDSLNAAQKAQSQREHIFVLFQPWALNTYGDQSKTKTITMRKKARILKALEGKEHSRPDSSKFRFWVKTKGFTTERPAGFEEAAGSQRRSRPLSPDAVLSDRPSEVDLFVASTSKDFGKRIYRKVAVVEEFFDIIYNVHMELGGRSGMHAGQKRTYRIITETYAFLPREAVTRFLSICPECKKNLRPSSPASSSLKEEPINDSSSEVEVLNYSSHTESSLDAGPAAKKRRSSNAEKTSLAMQASEVKVEPSTSFKASLTAGVLTLPKHDLLATANVAAKTTKKTQELPVNVPKIRVRTQLQRPLTPPALPATREAPFNVATTLPFQPFNPLQLDLNSLKSQESLLRYYEFMRRFYVGGTAGFLSSTNAAAHLKPLSVLTPTTHGSNLLQTLSYPSAQTKQSKSIHSPAAATTPCAASVKPKSTPTGPSVTQTPCATAQTPIAQPPLKKFKSSPDSLKSTNPASLAIPAVDIQVQSSAINLTKSFHFSSSNGATAAATTPAKATSVATTAPVTSTPTQVKSEMSTSPKTLPELRIPQLRQTSGAQGGGATEAGATATPYLPPLDLERLKPITSTYLQLTRSMGLSDEDALRFDNLVSNDFKYTL